MVYSRRDEYNSVMRLYVLVLFLAISAAAHAWVCYRTDGALIYVPLGQGPLAQRVEDVVPRNCRGSRRR